MLPDAVFASVLDEASAQPGAEFFAVAKPSVLARPSAKAIPMPRALTLLQQSQLTLALATVSARDLATDSERPAGAPSVPRGESGVREPPVHPSPRQRHGVRPWQSARQTHQ